MEPSLDSRSKRVADWIWIRQQLCQVLRKAEVMIRLAIIVCAMIIIMLLCNTAWYDGICIINENSSACKYGVALSALGWLTCLPFIIGDAVVRFTLFRERFKMVDIFDAVLSALFSILWFVCFSFTANQYSKTNRSLLIYKYAISETGVQAALAFCFISMVLWCMLLAIAVRRAKRAHNNFIGKKVSNGYSRFDDADKASEIETPTTKPLNNAFSTGLADEHGNAEILGS